MSEFEREVNAYCEHINELLFGFQEKLSEYLPLCPQSLFEKLRDGVVLTYLLHYFYPEAIKVDQLVHGINLDGDSANGNQSAVFEATANLNRVVEAAKGIKGLVVVNLGSEDILGMREDLVLGLLWQLIRNHLLGQVNLISHPELVRLLQPGESLAALAALKPEPLLIRWFNYHLERSGAECRVSSLSKDTANGEAYLHLIAAIKGIPLDRTDTDVLELVVRLAQEMGSQAKVKACDLASGHPRLNLAFLAGLFNAQVGIHLPSEEEIRSLYQEVAGLKSKVATLDQEIEAKRPREVELETLRRTSLDLNQQLAQIREAHLAELQGLELEFQQFKEELAAEYHESLETAIVSERRAHQHELGEAKAVLKEARRRLYGQIFEGAGALSGDLDGTKLGEMLKGLGEDSPLDQMLGIQSGLFRMLSQKAARQEKAILGLKEELRRKEKIEEVMAAKVKEYSEQLISESGQQQQAKKERGLSSFKSKTLPAIRRAFTCSGH